VSVIMAVHNGARYMREAIESILGQSFRDFEFLIVDDGSTDGSREIARAHPDPRIRLLENDRNLGLAASLNRGLRFATGEYIARQDDDDISAPERLARQVAWLDANPHVTVLGTWYYKMDQHGRLLGERRLPCTPVDIRWGLLFYCPLVHSAVTFRRRAILEEVGFYDETVVYAEDYDLWCRAARTQQQANLPEYLLKLRINPWSMTATAGERLMVPIRLAIRNIAALLGWDAAQPDQYLDRFRQLQHLHLGNPAAIVAEDLDRSLAELWQLHHAFCTVWRLPGEERETREAALRELVSDRLLRAASQRAWGSDRLQARTLLRHASRLHWPSVLGSRGLRATALTFGGAAVGRGLKRLAARPGPG
jgi:hypothetical protein